MNLLSSELKIVIYSIIIVLAIAGLIVYAILGPWPKNKAFEDEDIEVESKNTLKATINVVFYVIIFFGLSSIISSLLVKNYLNVNHIDYSYIQKGSENFNQEIYDQLDSELSPLLQLITYGLAFIVFFVVSFSWIKQDAKLIKGKTFLYALLGFGLIYAANIIGNVFLNILGLTNSSSNQSAITDMLSYSTSSMLIISFSTIFLAPIVEELVFRKSIFKLCRGHDRLAWVISSFAFGLIHVVSSSIAAISQGSYPNFVTEFIYIIPYCLMGAAIGFAYIKSGKNIFCSLFTHTLNNLVGIISALLLIYLKKLGISLF